MAAERVDTIITELASEQYQSEVCRLSRPTRTSATSREPCSQQLRTPTFEHTSSTGKDTHAPIRDIASTVACQIHVMRDTTRTPTDTAGARRELRAESIYAQSATRLLLQQLLGTSHNMRTPALTCSQQNYYRATKSSSCEAFH